MRRLLMMIAGAVGLVTTTIAQEHTVQVAKPAVRIVLGERAATGDAKKVGLGYTSTPLIEVTQPRPDTVVVVMTGALAIGGLPCENSAANLAYHLVQQLRVETAKPTDRVKLKVEAQLIGLVRSNREGPGLVTVGPAAVGVSCGGQVVTGADFPGRTHAGPDALFVSDRLTPPEVVAVGGDYALNVSWVLSGSHPRRGFHKNVATAVFGDGGKVPEWVALLDPNREPPKQKDLGLRVVLQAVAVSADAR